MQPFLLNLKKLSLLLAGSVGALLLACSKPQNSLKTRTYSNGSICIDMPIDWHVMALPAISLHDPRDSVFFELVGSEDQQLLIQTRKQPTAKVIDLSTRKILDSYYKSRSTAKFISVTIDSATNKLTVDYLAKHQGSNDYWYFRSITSITGNKWVLLEFRGPNNRLFIQRADSIATSLKSL